MILKQYRRVGIEFVLFILKMNKTNSMPTLQLSFFKNVAQDKKGLSCFALTKQIATIYYSVFIEFIFIFTVLFLNAILILVLNILQI